MGRCYLSLGQYSLGTSAYLQALNRNPEPNNSMLRGMGQCLMGLGLYPEAEYYLKLMTAKYPDNHGGWSVLGDIYLFQGENQKAMESYQMAIQKGSESCPECGPMVHGGLAELARRNHDYSTATKEIQIAYSKISSEAVANVYLESAWLYKDLGEKEKEITAWKNYLKFYPHDLFVNQAKTRLSELNSSP